MINNGYVENAVTLLILESLTHPHSEKCEILIICIHLFHFDLRVVPVPNNNYYRTHHRDLDSNSIERPRGGDRDRFNYHVLTNTSGQKLQNATP